MTPDNTLLTIIFAILAMVLYLQLLLLVTFQLQNYISITT